MGKSPRFPSSFTVDTSPTPASNVSGVIDVPVQRPRQKPFFHMANSLPLLAGLLAMPCQAFAAQGELTESPADLPWGPILFGTAGIAITTSLLTRWWFTHVSKPNRPAPAAPLPETPRDPGPPASVPPAPAPEGTGTSLPLQLISLDLSQVRDALLALKAKNVRALAAYLEHNPELIPLWRRLLRVTAANPLALQKAGVRDLPAFNLWYQNTQDAPWADLFRAQVFMLWGNQPCSEQEIQYQAPHDLQLTCYARLEFADEMGAPDAARASLLLVDLTAAKGAARLGTSGADITRDIFSHANLLLWWAKVRQQDGRFLWRMHLPEFSEQSPLFKLAGATVKGGLWDMDRMPDARQMNSTAEEAMLAGRNGYQSEFRALGEDGTHWIHENVLIQSVGPQEWSLIGVASDVTREHLAMESHVESEYNMRQILQGADCLLWRAQVVAAPPSTIWKMFVPPSVLYRRIFGHDPDNATPLLWQDQEIPEREEIYARSTRALYEGWSNYEQAFRVLAKGRTFWLHERVSITKKSETEWTLVGVIMDVTARKEAELALAAEKEHLEAMGTHAAGIARECDQALSSLSNSLLRMQAELKGGGPLSASLNEALTATDQARELNWKLAKLSTGAPSGDDTAGTRPTPRPVKLSTQSPFPAMESPSTPVQGNTQAPTTSRILLMDDEESILKLAARMLHKIGYEVDTSTSGEEAVEKYKAALAEGKPYHLVMMDLTIPGGMGGREALSVLKQIDPGVKAIVSSGYSSDSALAEYTALGFAGIVAKPYQMAELSGMVRKVLGTGSAT